MFMSLVDHSFSNILILFTKSGSARVKFTLKIKERGKNAFMSSLEQPEGTCSDKLKS